MAQGHGCLAAPITGGAPSAARCNPRHRCAHGQGCGCDQECVCVTRGHGYLGGQELELWTMLDWGAPRTDRAPQRVQRVATRS